MDLNFVSEYQEMLLFFRNFRLEVDREIFSQYLLKCVFR